MRRAAVALVAGLLAVPAWAQAPMAPGHIVVIGRGAVEVAPDVAVVQVGVTATGRTAAAALDANSAAVAKVADYARGAGVQPADIGTASVQLSPNFRTVRDPAGGARQEPDGYTASNTVRVRLRDLARVGAFARDLVDQGANRIDAIQFGLSQPERAADEARDGAVADAFRKAERLAAAARVSLGPVERIASPPPAPPVSVEGAPMAMRAAAPRRGPVPVEAGSIEVAAEVEITWSLR